MITDFKNKSPFLLGLLFLALATSHEIEHIAEAFEIHDEAIEIDCDYCEENQSQNLVNSKTNITFIDFDLSIVFSSLRNGSRRKSRAHKTANAPPSE